MFEFPKIFSPAAALEQPMPNVTLFSFPRVRSTQHITTAPWRTLVARWSMCEAVREGLAAHRHYEELMSRGMMHDRALRAALGIGDNSTTQRKGETLTPLSFAGRA